MTRRQRGARAIAVARGVFESTPLVVRTKDAAVVDHRDLRSARSKILRPPMPSSPATTAAVPVTGLS